MEKTLTVNNYTFDVCNNNAIRHAYNAYRSDFKPSLFHAYGSFSYAKQLAFNYCYNMARTLGGVRLSIVSHNCNVFTVGFKFKQGGTHYFAWITPTYNRVMPISN